MAILNLPTFTEQAEKTPEQKMLESLQQMQIERPQAEVPRFTRYGNRMAERGGFDVLPQEQLSGMTQQQVDQYEAERRKARGSGISETLMRVGQAFAGQDADAGIVQRQQARQQAEQEAQTQRMLASMTPEQRQIYNMKKIGLPDSYIQSQFYPKQEKKGTQRYTVYDRETGKPIRSISAYDQEAINAAENNPKELIGSFAGLSEDKPSKLNQSDFVVDILTKIQKDPNYKLSDSEQKILDIIERTDPMEILRRESLKRYMQSPVSVKDGQSPVSVKDGQDPKYKDLKDGDAFKVEGDETIYYKNQ
jgi:hypothetical protein